ncbi:nucleotide exchange factor GrpE [Deltaproteobacteria bacterium TL4]
MAEKKIDVPVEYATEESQAVSWDTQASDRAESVSVETQASQASRCPEGPELPPFGEKNADANVEETSEAEVVDEKVVLAEKLAQAEEKARETYDRYLRLNAEFDNFKKRMAKENSDKFKYYNMGLIKELLPAIDSFDRAIAHASKNETSDGSLQEGLGLVRKMMMDAFEKSGVSVIAAVGEVFDPNCHQAIGMVESDTVPENHVVDEFQPGYFLYDRIIRPAMVRVAKKS